MDVRDDDIEFIPTDDLIEHDEPGGADEAAVSVEVPDQPRQRMTIEDEDFEAEEMEMADEEPVAEAARAASEAEKIEVLEEAGEEEYEPDLEEILRRHAGLEEPEGKAEETEAAAPDQRVVQTPPVREFVCAGCFLRRPISQLADPERGLCADCAASS